MNFKSIFIFLILHFNILFAQSISLDIGKSFPGESFDIDWKSDFTLGISSEIPVYDIIKVKPFFYYCSFKFDTGGILEGPDEVKNFKFNRHDIISIGALINVGVNRIFYLSPYFQVGLGYMIANLEDITYIYGPDNYEALQEGYTFKGKMIDFGFGLQLNHFEKIKPFIEFNYLAASPEKKISAENDFSYYRLSIGFKFILFGKKST